MKEMVAVLRGFGRSEIRFPGEFASKECPSGGPVRVPRRTYLGHADADDVYLGLGHFGRDGYCCGPTTIAVWCAGRRANTSLDGLKSVGAVRSGKSLGNGTRRAKTSNGVRSGDDGNED